MMETFPAVTAPRWHWRRRDWLPLVLAVLCGAFLVGNFVFPGRGPLYSKGTYGYGYAAPPGRLIDYPVMVFNSSGTPARIESVSLIPVPGFGVPVLRHVAFSAQHLDLALYDSWPPKRMPGDPSAEIVALSKVLVTNQHQEILLVGVVAPHKGDYGFAGLAIHYEAGESQYVAKIWDTGELCARARNCSDANDRFDSAAAGVERRG